MPRRRPQLVLLQLPIPQTVPLAPTGNVPLAAGCLALAARAHGVGERLDVRVLPPEVTDVYGDTLLADEVAAGEPEYVGLSLYLWNSDRSLNLGRMIKERSPRTRVIIGGPEVGADNPFVLHQKGYDLAVTGEAEETFAGLLAALLDGRDPRGLPEVAVRGPLGMGPFGAACAAQFPLDAYPSPYLDGTVPVAPERSTYVETVRGCRSHCTFCFYPRSSSVLRVLDVPQSAALVRRLGDLGAREIVFLDPTFNHRPELEPLLVALAAENQARHLSFFAEVRAEGLTAAHADLLAQAGFTKLEIGLQSVSKKTLKHTKRGGNPEKVAAAARLLKERGIDVIVDLIVGLPGDTADDVRRGMEFLDENDLADDAQVFALSLLPGTEMRAAAERDGIEFDPAPPYRVRRTATFDAGEINEVMDWAEKRLQRPLDESVRPLLAEGDRAGPPSRFAVDLDLRGDSAGGGGPDLDRPGAQHASLWLSGTDLWRDRDRAAAAIARRLAVDPHAMLDVVLSPRGEFPLDLVAHLRAVLDAAPQSYPSRMLRHRGVDAQRRLSVVLPDGAGLDPEYCAALQQSLPVFAAQPGPAAAAAADELGATRPGAYVTGAVDEASWRRLAEGADPEAVAFEGRDAERRWVWDVLGYREVR